MIDQKTFKLLTACVDYLQKTGYTYDTYTADEFVLRFLHNTKEDASQRPITGDPVLTYEDAILEASRVDNLFAAKLIEHEESVKMRIEIAKRAGLTGELK